MMENQNILKNIQIVSDVLYSGESAVIQNKEIGNISLDQGEAKKNSFGINHIIYERYKNDGKNESEIAALLILLADTVENGKVSRDVTVRAPNEKDIGRYEIENNGIIAIVSKQRHGKDEKFVITGFEDINKEEAADAVQTGIAQYGYTPEFSYFRKQVGAVVSSLKTLSHQSNNKSREIEAARKAGYVQGVCECVAAVGSAAGEDYTLGKKLLSEMNVTKDMAKKYANPETYKSLEKGIFAQKEQRIEQTHNIKR